MELGVWSVYLSTVTTACHCWSLLGWAYGQHKGMVVCLRAEAASGTNEGLGLPGLIRNRMS